MKRFIVIGIAIFVVLSIILIGYVTSLNVEKTEVAATVTCTKFEKAYTQMVPMYNPATKTTTTRPQRYPAKYLVTIVYEDVAVTVNSKELYDSVHEGDTIQMICCKYYNKNQQLVKQNLEIAE